MKSTLVLIVIFILSSFLTTKAQGLNKYRVPYLNALPRFISPEKELEILPDTPSYHVIQEMYNADTLTYKGNQLTFNNNGKDRSCILYIYPLDVQKIYLERINNSYSVQTTEDVDNPNGRRDTTLVWWKKGLISKASVVRFGFRREYTFEYDKRKLVRKVVDYGQSDSRETQFFYQGNQLIKMVYTDSDSRSETSISYSDSLITSTALEGLDSSQYVIKGFTSLDDKGRIVSIKTFMKRPQESELSLYQSQEYSYTNDSYQVVYTMYLPDGPYVSKKEIRPGLPVIERWTWKDDDQVWILKSYPD